MNKKEKYLLFLVMALALTLRVYKLAEHPAGLNADEASIGYNAYSLALTGKDEFGHSWPMAFQSFNDFKPGFYFYLVLPFVKVLGLNETAVRLPSALLGVLTALTVFLLVKEFFGTRTGLLASLLLAVSPWHLHFSRGGWESNASVFLITAGIYLFILSLRRPKYLWLSALFFVLSLYTYHSARIISPLLLLGLVVWCKKELFVKEKVRPIIISLVVGVLLTTPLLLSFFGPTGVSRFSGVGIFADQGPFWRINELRGHHQNPYSLFPRIMHNKAVEYGVRFFDNWLRHYRGDFLFISGDEIQRNKIPEMGQMYLIEAPFLLLGLYFLLRKKPQSWQFWLWWLAMAPTASALTFQSPHAIRALSLVIPLAVITAYGLNNAIDLVKKVKYYKIIFFVMGLLFFWNVSFYLHQYYVHYSKTYPAAWEDGFRELVSYVSANQERFEKINITDKYDQPYILFAFYLKYPPEVFQKEAKLTDKDQYGFSTVPGFGKYSFGKINYEELKNQGKIMIVGAPNEIPDSATIVKRIFYKDGKTEAFRIVEN